MQIEFENISKKYGKYYALDHFCANFNNGIYGLLGANGAGKTTLINIFVGILKRDSGVIRIDGRDVAELGKDFLEKIGYMPQYPVFYKDFRVLEFLLYMCELKGINKKAGLPKSIELLEIVNLKDSADKKIGALSGGMRQRLGIVQAMLSDPDVLILDEPTAGLDPQERIRFRNLISKFSRDRIVLLATHIVSDVEFIANDVLILKRGKLIRMKTPKELEDEIFGKVWTIVIDENLPIEKYEHFKICNILREENNLKIRMLAEERPDKDAAIVKPNLEDVFLYYNDETFN